MQCPKFSIPSVGYSRSEELSLAMLFVFVKADAASIILLFTNQSPPKGKSPMARSVQPQSRYDAPKLELSSYSFEELIEFKRNVDSEVESRRAKEVDDLRARVTETAQALGVSIEELFNLRSAKQRSTRQTKHPRGKQQAKYRGPNGEEWSGKGPAPRWMKPFLEKGKTKADFLIK
jgi:DNA-binding protein H-NS